VISGAGRIVPGAVVLAILAACSAASARPAATVQDRTKLSWPTKCIVEPISIPFRGGRWIFPELRTLRARVWTSELSWVKVARRKPKRSRSPSDPAYRWPAGLDLAFNKARSSGIEPVLYVNGFPAWSNGGRNPTWVPQKPADYANFMAAAVRRYPQVRRWIVFAEPTHYVNFQPQGDGGRRAPRLYARLLDAAYRAMHAVRPDVIVIGGNMHPAGKNDEETTAPDTFLRHMVLPNGRRPQLDMFGINPYTERPLDMALPYQRHRVDFNDLDWLARQLDHYWPGRSLRLFVEEFGWNTEHEASGWLYYVSREKQAAELTKAFRIAARFRRIDTMCWFQLHDAPPHRDGDRWLNWTSGLRTWKRTKKPAWKAFARVPGGPRTTP
jgi:hypothetical protein